MKDEAGNPTSLVGRATIGAVIEVLVNHGEGVLSYRINGGPVLEALKGFPKGAAGQLRPWVTLFTANTLLTEGYGFGVFQFISDTGEDRVTFTIPYLRYTFVPCEIRP